MPARSLVRTVGAAPALAVIALLGCGEGRGISNSPETWRERAARQQAEFEATPNVALPEVRRRLAAMGVPKAAITETVEEHGVTVLALRPTAAVFDQLDKPVLARLLLDSRYRFDFVDPKQVSAFAQFVGAENDRRETAKARREIFERGETDRLPVYRAGSSLTLYALRLERYCGYQPGQALEVIDGRWLNYRPTMVDMSVAEPLETGAAEKFDCMKRAVDALELRRRFIGNRGRHGAKPS